MNEAILSWFETVAHWLIAWTIVVLCVTLWLALFRPRRPSVIHAGWMAATFSGALLISVAMFISHRVSRGSSADAFVSQACSTD